MRKNIYSDSDMVSKGWKDFAYDLPNQIVTIPQIRASAKAFWNEVYFNEDQRDKKIFVQFKVRTGRHMSRSISYVQRVGYSDLDNLVDSFLGFWSVRSELYKIERFYQIIYTYKIIFKNSLKTQILIDKKMSKEVVPFFNFYGYDLPLTMNYREWGIYIESASQSLVTIYKLKSKIEYRIKIYEDKHEISVYMNNRLMFQFVDVLLDVNDLSTFHRVIKEQEYVIIKGNLELKVSHRKGSYLSEIQVSKLNAFNVITMDLETLEEEGRLVPYCISLFDGVKSVSYYASNYSDSTDMLVNALSYIMRRKYHGYKVYLHNFSRFDGVFLLKVFALVSDEVLPIIREDKIIEIRLKYGGGKNGKSNYYLVFRDSYLLLSHSLKDLGVVFNVEHKGIFPHRFVNNKIGLNYEGPVPGFSFFDGISLQEYKNYQLKYLNKIKQSYLWNLKREIISYCEQDCRTLYQILSVFHEQVFTYFEVDFLKFSTLSSLSLGIYRTHFLLSNQQIPLIGGDMFKDLHYGYTGGSVDVYSPYGENVYRYDVNSLYPDVMLNNLMPVGLPVYFEGNISLLETRPFGIFKVKVKCLEGMNKPVLQHRIIAEYGARTISPIGFWEGTYFSEEIFNSVQLGYQVQIVRGYIFRSSYLFKDYVSFLFDLKMSSSKHDVLFTISKLLLNSLYGRFGMDPLKEVHSVVGSEKSVQICSDYEVTNIIPLSSEKELISYRREFKEGSVPNISIPISLAVTAYARIAMTNYKSWSGSSVLYTDTDSVDLSNNLSLNKIGRSLGLMKLEEFFDSAVFLAPKVYGGMINNSNIEGSKGGLEYVKVKGLKNRVSYASLFNLLLENKSLNLLQEKWYRNLSLGVLEIRQEIFTLMVTENKRKLLFQSKKEYMKTLPLVLVKGELSVSSDPKTV